MMLGGISRLDARAHHRHRARDGKGNFDSRLPCGDPLADHLLVNWALSFIQQRRRA